MQIKISGNYGPAWRRRLWRESRGVNVDMEPELMFGER